MVVLTIFVFVFGISFGVGLIAGFILGVKGNQNVLKEKTA